MFGQWAFRILHVAQGLLLLLQIALERTCELTVAHLLRRIRQLTLMLHLKTLDPRHHVGNHIVQTVRATGCLPHHLLRFVDEASRALAADS